MITAIGARTFGFLLFLAGLISAFSGPVAYAAQTDCIGEVSDGRVVCAPQYPTPMLIGPCDNAASTGARERAWCEASGGVFQGIFAPISCLGDTIFSEDNVVDRSVAFGKILKNDQACAITSDTGWNATFPTTNFCLGGNGKVFQDGFLVFDSRQLVLSCGETVSIIKDRSLKCPPGFTVNAVFRNGSFHTTCSRLLEPPCPTCANPVLPGTGVKVETETDYRHPKGLGFVRHYHSYRSQEPFTTVPGAHPQNQLGPVWRSNYDKRIVPTDGPIPLLALTLPTGAIQYFDTVNNEVFNYSGAKARLVTLSGGYLYLGAEDTELYRADGRLQAITRRSGEVFTLAYSDGTTGPNGGFALDLAGNPTLQPAPVNLLVRVTDSYGNALSFGYNLREQLVLMTDPGGGHTLYSYDVAATNENLASVRYPDGRTRTYRYTEPANLPANFPVSAFPHALTSIVDENGDLFASFKYDTDGRAVSSEHAGGTQRYQFTYNSATSVTVTDPLGAARTLTSEIVDGMWHFAANSLAGGADYGAGIQSRTYDTAGNILSQTDFNNFKTCYAYDPVRNLQTVRVEGLASATSCDAVTGSGAALPAGSRKIATEWHARWRMPVRMSEPSRRSAYLYNGDAGASCAPASAVIADGSANGQPIGVLCTKTVQSTSDANGAQGFVAPLQGQARTWAYTHDARGRVLTADGPRTDASDITATTYYADDDLDLGKRGNVATITNALGHVTSITEYDVHGQPLSIVDPNGLTTALGYDARQRLASRSVGGELTTYVYDAVGQLALVTLPDNSSLTYSYDAAHRLTGINDNLGNRIAYTLDAMGNRTREEVFDPANALAQTRSRVYNNLNRLAQEIGAQNQMTQYAYDNQGNLTSIDGPLAGTLDLTTNAYDALNRLIRVTDPNLGQTQYAYNGIDQLVGVTDPRSLATTYNYDGLANLNSQVSPDTGSTVNSFDAAGNLLTQTDAKGQVTTYTYDALNRVTSIAFHDGAKQTYAYDQGPNGLGRLSSITETDPQSQVTSLLAYAYDQRGRTTSETRTINGVAYVLGYGYDSAGRLSGMSYPSGRTIAYGFDALGRINQVSTTPQNGTQQLAASAIAYQPFGGVKGYTLGNGQTTTRSYDLDGRIAGYNLGTQSFAIGYDAASRISFISETAVPANVNTYSYDNLDRLIGAVLPNLPFAYAYDAVGNRTSKTVGASSDTYAYGAASNRLASITAQAGAVRSFTFDPNGSTGNDGVSQYAYDARGRMVQSTGVLGTTAYQVNALGQRIRKTNTTEDRVFLYDTRGRLIAETDPGGTLRREYLYLNDIPLAVIQ